VVEHFILIGHIIYRRGVVDIKHKQDPKGTNTIATYRMNQKRNRLHQIL